MEVGNTNLEPNQTKLEEPTPCEENECNGSSFSLEDIVPDLAVEQHLRPVNEEAPTGVDGTESFSRRSKADIHEPGCCVKLVTGVQKMASAISKKLKKSTSEACRQQHVGITRNNLGEQNVKVANDKLEVISYKWEDI